MAPGCRGLRSILLFLITVASIYAAPRVSSLSQANHRTFSASNELHQENSKVPHPIKVRLRGRNYNIDHSSERNQNLDYTANWPSNFDYSHNQNPFSNQNLVHQFSNQNNHLDHPNHKNKIFGSSLLENHNFNYPVYQNSGRPLRQNHRISHTSHRNQHLEHSIGNNLHDPSDENTTLNSTVIQQITLLIQKKVAELNQLNSVCISPAHEMLTNPSPPQLHVDSSEQCSLPRECANIMSNAFCNGEVNNSVDCCNCTHIEDFIGKKCRPETIPTKDYDQPNVGFAGQTDACARYINMKQNGTEETLRVELPNNRQCLKPILKMCPSIQRIVCLDILQQELLDTVERSQEIIIERRHRQWRAFQERVRTTTTVAPSRGNIHHIPYEGSN